MRVRSFPFTTTFITFIVVCWFPLLEFDINWNYKDWDQTISNRTGTVILDETKKLNFQRVPGINPGWKRAKSVVEKMLNSVNDAKLPEYQYEWKYVSMNRVSASEQEFHVNANIGGYVAKLYPRSLNLTDHHRGICLISNMDSVYGSNGFSSNAISVTQAILAMEELSQHPGLVTPVIAVISDTHENGSNVLMNLLTTEDLKRCLYSIILDSQGIAQTVPEVLYEKKVHVKGSAPLFSGRHFRVSNYVLDSSPALQLLSTSELQMIYRQTEGPSFIKLMYVDMPFYHHTPSDQPLMAKAAAVKARYDSLVQIVGFLSRVAPDTLQKPRFGDFDSFISVFGVTKRVSSLTQLVLVVIGITFSVLFLTVGNMGQTQAVQSGQRHALVVFALQVVVYCVTVVVVLMWLSLEPLTVHQLNAYLVSLILCMLLMSMTLGTLQIQYYIQYFMRDYAGAAMSMCSIIYGVIGLLLLGAEQHMALNFVIPCVCFGLTNLPLFLRKIHLGDRYRWKKATYAVCLVLCGCVCYFVNMGSACATLHVTYWGMNTEDLTVCVIVVFSFWAALFPMLFCMSCLKVIYMVDEQVEQKPSVLSVSMLDDLLEEMQPSVKEEETEEKKEKIVYRRFMNEVSISVFVLLVVIMVSTHNLPAWNSDKPVHVYAGLSHVNSVYDDKPNDTVEGHLMIGGHERVQRQIEKVLKRVRLQKGYSVESITRDWCYLEDHIKRPCLDVEMARNGVPIRFNTSAAEFGASQLEEISLPEATNITMVTKRFRVTVPWRNHTDVFGYPVMLFRIYTTNIEDKDSKVYSNPIEVMIEYGGVQEEQKGFVIQGTVMTNLQHDMSMNVTIRSRTGSQVVFRMTDVGHSEPSELMALGEGLGTGFVYSGMSSLSFLSYTVNYFISFWNVCWSKIAICS